MAYIEQYLTKYTCVSFLIQFVILSLYCIWSLKLDVLCIRHAVYFGYIFQNNNTMSIYQWPIDTFVKNVFTEWFLWFIHISSSYSINDLISIILSSLNRGVESLQSQPWLCSSVVPLRNRVVTVTVTWLYNTPHQSSEKYLSKIAISNSCISLKYYCQAFKKWKKQKNLLGQFFFIAIWIRGTFYEFSL